MLQIPCLKPPNDDMFLLGIGSNVCPFLLFELAAGVD